MRESESKSKSERESESVVCEVELFSYILITFRENDIPISCGVRFILRKYAIRC